LIADSTSPDGRFALFATEDKVTRNLLVAVSPFRVVATLHGEAFFPEYVKNRIQVSWAPDSSAVLVAVEFRWGVATLQLLDLRTKGTAGQVNLRDELYYLACGEHLDWDMSKRVADKLPRGNHKRRGQDLQDERDSFNPGKSC
jgi:hypothetical protein